MRRVVLPPKTRALLVVALTVAGGSAALAACSLLTDTDGLSGGHSSTDTSGGDAADSRTDATGDSAADTAMETADTAADTSADTSADTGADSDAKTDAPIVDTGDSAVSPSCVAEAGAAMVAVGDSGSCIDRTEVTVADYRLFLAARGGDTSGQRADCVGNLSFLLEGFPATGEDHLPVIYADFCDALAFCAWAGKRLCGDPDGTPVPHDGGADPAVDQWYHACSRNDDGLHVFPYGATFDATKCNAYESDAGGRREVGATPTCEGGYPGIFDMAGNVAEWEDYCEPADGGRVCSARGGNWNEFFSTESACKPLRMGDPTKGSSTTGFRCCSR